MKLSVKSDYAARAVLALARTYHSGEAQKTAEDLAREQNIPANYLVQILIELKSQHIVRSLRGKQGGYLLARSPAEVTLGDVLRCVHGQVFDTPALGDAQCPPELRRAWKKLQAAMDKTADSIHFGQLPHQRKGCGNEDQLAQLHTHIEEEQRKREFCLWHACCGKPAGETEAVQQPGPECYDPGVVDRQTCPTPPGTDYLRPEEKDAESDGCVKWRQWHSCIAKGGYCKSDTVRDCEGSNGLKEHKPAFYNQQQAKNKKQMINALQLCDGTRG